MTGWRYAAMLGPQDAVAERAADRRLRDCGLVPAARLPGISLFVSRDCPWLSSRDGVLVVGRLLRRTDGRPCDPGDAEWGAAANAAERLTRRFWGSYVAFMPDGGGHAVLRDPSGGVPVYGFGLGDVTVWCSDIAVARALEVALHPDPDFIGSWLLHPYLRGARTGCAGVSELVPGTMVRGAAPPVMIWNPWTFAAPEARIDDREQAIERLGRALRMAIAAPFRDERDLWVQLSGGLDSSIVAAALGAAGAAPHALNYRTSTRDGDEREYARAVAQRFGLALDELLAPDPAPGLPDIGPAGFRPPPNHAILALQAAIRDHAVARGARWLIDGAGGDNIFCHSTTVAPLADAWRAGGLAAAARCAGDLSRITGSPIGRVMTMALRRGLRRRRAWKQDRTFLSRAFAGDRPEAHPWLDAPGNAWAGKREHVAALVSIRHFLERGLEEVGPHLVHPLLAQPLMETCVAIPAEMWVAGGRDRSVARDAFADLLPPAVRDRRGKGRLESLFLKTYVRDRPALRTILLDGELAQRGLIDRAALETYLAREGEPGDVLYVRILHIAALELWLAALAAPA
ncbi:asparagine synthase-related protein [Allosphingosinicella indica]|uniref:asparagine synthase (glutamine-hydrolyzing) n=1 Tax=Allosphingosinicella indica TaxID=941907 RepID=A0A1X7FYH8_9SPHN|nr:asparagine synthase-related protein [Allosphingosinicella indica]SMF60991.1 asparagine synthase (glutamine-hydrolysing) [Allosphingosinicella indica]